MGTIDRGSRMTYAQLKAHFDGIAKMVQDLATYVGDDFTSLTTSGYTNGTLARGVDIAIDGTTTGLLGLTSVNALAKLAGPYDAVRKKLTAQTNALTTEFMVRAGYGEVIKELMATFAASYDDTYASFWEAFAALYTSGEYVPGEVVDIMNAVGIKPDPAYCYPPEHKLLTVFTFTGATTATVTTYDEIDPLLYTAQATANVEWYALARAADTSAAGISVSMGAARDEDDAPTDTGATTFTFTVDAADAVGATGALVQTNSKLFCSSRDLVGSGSGQNVTITGAVSGDIIALRVKTLRSMAYPT